jgi:hypothetical protein
MYTRFGRRYVGESACDLQQTISFLFHDRVALAAALFKAGPIKYHNMTALIADQSSILQPVSRNRHTLTANTQSGGDNLLGRDQFTGVLPIQSARQPAAYLLIH